MTEKVLNAEKLLQNLTLALEEMTDTEVGAFFTNGRLNELLKSILDPSEVRDHPSIAEFFLARKNRLTTMAVIRTAITKACSFQPSSKKGYVSPMDVQWFEDGVMLLEGEQPFEGLIGLYQDGVVKQAVAARDIQKDENLGKEDFLFLSVEEYKKLYRKIPADDLVLDDPVKELQALLDIEESKESKYQELLHKYPWVFGLQYSQIQRHTNLDDRNIPDFTGSRVNGLGVMS